MCVEIIVADLKPRGRSNEAIYASLLLLWAVLLVM